MSTQTLEKLVKKSSKSRDRIQELESELRKKRFELDTLFNSLSNYNAPISTQTQDKLEQRIEVLQEKIDDLTAKLARTSFDHEDIILNAVRLYCGL